MGKTAAEDCQVSDKCSGGMLYPAHAGTPRCVIGKKIAGIDPDGTEAEREDAERNWLEKHPPVQKSGEEREKLAARMRFLRGNPS